MTNTCTVFACLFTYSELYTLLDTIKVDRKLKCEHTHTRARTHIQIGNVYTANRQIHAQKNRKLPTRVHTFDFGARKQQQQRRKGECSKKERVKIEQQHSRISNLRREEEKQPTVETIVDREK